MVELECRFQFPYKSELKKLTHGQIFRSECEHKHLFRGKFFSYCTWKFPHTVSLVDGQIHRECDYWVLLAAISAEFWNFL